VRAPARSGAAVLVGCVALLAGCGEQGPRFGVEEIRAHVRSLAAEPDRDADSVALFERVARDVEAIDLGELPAAVALPVPYGGVTDRRAALVAWGTDSAVARALEAALAPLADAAVPLGLSPDAPSGAALGLDLRRVFDLSRRVRPRLVALVDAGETEAALDLLAAWIQFTRGACAFGPSGAPLAAGLATRPESVISLMGVEAIVALDGRDAARLSGILRSAPSVAGWSSHNYVRDALMLIEDPAAVEADLLGLRATYFDPPFLQALMEPLSLDRDEFRARCAAAIARTPLTEVALRSYADAWDDLVRSSAAVVAIDALRGAASGAEPSRLECRRGVVRMEIVADLDGGVVTYESTGATEFSGEISF